MTGIEDLRGRKRELPGARYAHNETAHPDYMGLRCTTDTTQLTWVRVGSSDYKIGLTGVSGGRNKDLAALEAQIKREFAAYSWAANRRGSSTETFMGLTMEQIARPITLMKDLMARDEHLRFIPRDHDAIRRGPYHENLIIPVVGPHWAGKTTLIRRALGDPTPGMRLDEERALQFGQQLTARKRNKFSYLTRPGLAYFKSANGLVFPVGKFDGAANAIDTVDRLGDMQHYGPVIVGDPVKFLVEVVTDDWRTYHAFRWPVIYVLSPPKEVVWERAQTRNGAVTRAGFEERYGAWPRYLRDVLSLTSLGARIVALYDLPEPDQIAVLRGAGKDQAQ